MNLIMINVWTRKLRRAVRLPEGDLPVTAGDGTSKSAASRRFVALSAERVAEWMASDLSKLDLLIIQVDGLHIGNDLRRLHPIWRAHPEASAGRPRPTDCGAGL